MNIKADVSKARARLLLKFPFWGVLSLNMEINVSDNIDTMSTNGRSISVNPDYWTSLPEDIKMSEVAHEVFHCAFGHLWRGSGRIKSVFNVACDIVADYHLQKSGLPITPQSVLHTFGHIVDPTRSVEEVYQQLLSSDLAKNRLLQEYENMHDWPANVDQETQSKWKVAVANAVAVSYPGTIPGHIKELLDITLNPKLDWKQLLRDFLMVARSEYSWIPPNKKFVHNGTIVPCLCGESLEVIFAIDTSGSMTLSDIKMAISEVISIQNTFKESKLWIVQADYVIQSVHLMDDTNEEINKIEGRGGTKLLVKDIYDEIVNRGGDPNCLIYFTDGWGDIDGYCSIPVIWLLSSNNDNFRPPFGWIIKYNQGG